jgi:hypothetical protein
MAFPSGKDGPAALEKAKLTDDRPTPEPKSVSPGKSAGASQDIDTALSFAGEHLWILRALFTGDVQTLYQSGDLGGVFLYIIALHNTFKDRAPALYDEGTQLQLGAAYAKFGVSGHNIESVLDDVYKYYDAELIQGRAMGNRYAIGYTLSRTPPNAEVASIEEWFSVFRRDVLDDGEIISRGRTIPRSKVIPVPISEVTTSISTGTGFSPSHITIRRLRRRAPRLDLELSI